MDESVKVEKLPDRQGIKTWPLDDRPREKLQLKGVEALSNAELIAILLRTSGNRNKTALEVAQELLQIAEGDLYALSRLSVKDCMKIKGIGSAKAVTLVAALELGRRRQSAAPVRKPVIKRSRDAADLLQPRMADLRHEVFVVLYLSTSNKVLHEEKISKGGSKGTMVDPKIVMKVALEQDANNMILCHNHPSGNLKPSKADIRLTQKLIAAAQLLDLKILDHLIVSSQGFYSFADEGLM